MDIQNKVVVVTGGASGIGAALCRAFAKAGAKGVVVADLSEAGAAAVAAEVGGLAIRCDVSLQSEVADLVDQATRHYGQVDIFCSNAGVISRMDSDAPAAIWQRHWDVNVMAHVHAANAVLPQMLARGEGYLLQTISVAGLIPSVNSAPYTSSKFAAYGFAEWLSIAHGEAGIQVSCLCPQGVRTPMIETAGGEHGRPSFIADQAMSAEAVAELTLQGMQEGRFLILPSEGTETILQRKREDLERWLRGMRRLRAKVMAQQENL